MTLEPDILLSTIFFSFLWTKIDRSFIRQIKDCRKSREIVRLALGVARTLEAVAEGVETVDQMEFLVENGCRCIQGYLTGRPSRLQELFA
jgi:EAL domain-containing protein (putative c-di-GMP-specific phosphodiesterase class I)